MGIQLELETERNSKSNSNILHLSSVEAFICRCAADCWSSQQALGLEIQILEILVHKAAPIILDGNAHGEYKINQKWCVWKEASSKRHWEAASLIKRNWREQCHIEQVRRESRFKSRTQLHASNAIVKLSMLKWIWQVQINLYIDKGNVNSIVWMGGKGCNKESQQRLFFLLSRVQFWKWTWDLGERSLWLSAWAEERWTISPNTCCKTGVHSSGAVN